MTEINRWVQRMMRRYAVTDQTLRAAAETVAVSEALVSGPAK